METVTLGVSGMTCGGCVRSVTKVLNALNGVEKADVSLEKKLAVVDAQKNACLFFYKDVDLGTIQINTDQSCKQFENTCYEKNKRLLDLGSSRIGTMQLQFLDVKLKPGF